MTESDAFLDAAYADLRGSLGPDWDFWGRGFNNCQHHHCPDGLAALGVVVTGAVGLDGFTLGFVTDAHDRGFFQFRVPLSTPPKVVAEVTKALLLRAKAEHEALVRGLDALDERM